MRTVRYILSRLAFVCSIASMFLVQTFFVFASDASQPISSGTSTGSGSNTNVISVSYPSSTGSGATNYTNKDADSEVIGNYFQGYYYDSQYGFFKLDWSSDASQNVRIIGSTNACGSGYGYLIGGYARSNDYGFINFQYDPAKGAYVYYCENDQKFHGYAYGADIGFQNFSGIGFQIATNGIMPNLSAFSSDPFFVNNSTMLLSETPDAISASGNASSSNQGSVQGDQSSTDWGRESLFYIIKTR